SRLQPRTDHAPKLVDRHGPPDREPRARGVVGDRPRFGAGRCDGARGASDDWNPERTDDKRERERGSHTAVVSTTRASFTRWRTGMRTPRRENARPRLREYVWWRSTTLSPAPGSGKRERVRDRGTLTAHGPEHTLTPS